MPNNSIFYNLVSKQFSQVSPTTNLNILHNGLYKISLHLLWHLDDFNPHFSCFSFHRLQRGCILCGRFIWVGRGLSPGLWPHVRVSVEREGWHTGCVITVTDESLLHAFPITHSMDTLKSLLHCVFMAICVYLWFKIYDILS